MNNYVDKWGRYHHKPVTPTNIYPSNNGWIYTAYAAKAGLPVDMNKLQICFENCKKVVNGKVTLLRHPIGYKVGPTSRDEILGMAALGFLKPEHLDGWNFSPFPIPKFNLIETLKQFWEIKDKHRNYFWQNNLTQVYRFAFSVPLSDRHFILKKWGKFNIFYWIIATLDGILSKPDNGIPWLKESNNNIIYMKAEFPTDHPLRNV